MRLAMLHAVGATLFKSLPPLILLAAATISTAMALEPGASPIAGRNMDVLREAAAEKPRSAHEQAIVDGWPLYRTPRGQYYFNRAMATLRATDTDPPSSGVFAGCDDLECPIDLPQISQSGWIPAGRLWLSQETYVLFVRAPRQIDDPFRRRSARSMRYFIFHEFHNGTGNVDPFDTAASHSGAVYVTFYLSKTYRDARGRRFVVVLQVAPYDVVSIHATNLGNAGSGIEVAKNYGDGLEPLQSQAGILVATIVKEASPHLQVVNHRGSEGRPMLHAYVRRLRAIRGKCGSRRLRLPFAPISANHVREARGEIWQLIRLRNVVPPEGTALAARPEPRIRPEPQEDARPAPPVVARLNRGPTLAREQATADAFVPLSPLTSYLMASPDWPSLVSPPRLVLPSTR